MQQNYRKGIFQCYGAAVFAVASDTVPIRIRLWVEFLCGSGSDPIAKQVKMLKTNG
jgi:hypothetical protein